jgi:hypothetical protein
VSFSFIDILKYLPLSIIKECALMRILQTAALSFLFFKVLHNEVFAPCCKYPGKTLTFGDFHRFIHNEIIYSIFNFLHHILTSENTLVLDIFTDLKNSNEWIQI